jgi:hypothetical protein
MAGHFMLCQSVHNLVGIKPLDAETNVQSDRLPGPTRCVEVQIQP